MLAVYLFAQGGAQTCPGSGSCNCKINNVESLLALVRDKVETQVEQEVVERLANMSSKGCSEYGIPWHVPTSFFTWIYIKLSCIFNFRHNNTKLHDKHDMIMPE